MSLNKSKKDLMDPHKKDYLTTSFGRRVDSISYLQLLGGTFFVWLCVSLYFAIATYFQHGMNFDPTCVFDTSNECEKKTLIEVVLSSLYFSGVTLTTLGYGDISPIGFGRAVAVLLSMSGLTIIAILIAKISSERQSSLLLLLHTSDVERRMSDFVSQIEEYNQELSSSFKDNEIDLTYKRLRGLRSLLEAVSSYIAFHVNQAMFLEIGTDTAIKSLMSKMGEVHPVLDTLEPMALNTEKVETGCLSVAKRMRDIETFLVAQNEYKGTGIKNIDSSKLEQKYIKLKQKYNTAFTEAKVSKVKKLLPKAQMRGQWPKNLNRTIADELGVSVQMVKRCINELKNRGEC